MLTSEKYIERLIALWRGSDKYWDFTSKEESEQKIKSETNEANKIEKEVSSNINIPAPITSQEYSSVEQKTILYLENKYNLCIQKEVKVTDRQNCSRSIYFDGIAVLPQKDILIEVKYARNKESINRLCYVALNQLMTYSNLYRSNKNIELMLVLVTKDVDIETKNRLTIELNKEVQNKLITTPFSGNVVILTVNEINN